MDSPKPKNRKQIITIAGRPGSGKSTTAKAVANRLGFEHFSSGDLFRKLAEEQGIDVHAAITTSGINDMLDELVDGKLQQIGRTDDKKVIDSRTAWHWIPDSFKVFLDLDLEIAAQRILATQHFRINENTSSDPSTYAQFLKARLESEMQRYKQQYGIDPYNLKNYDLVVDTAANNLDQTVNLIVQQFKKWSTA